MISECDITKLIVILVVWWLAIDACYAMHSLYSFIKKIHKVQNVIKIIKFYYKNYNKISSKQLNKI